MLISKFDHASDEFIAEYEDTIENRLPSSYKTFLKKYNGGETPNTSFSTKDIGSDIKAFYGVGNVKYSLNLIKIISANGANFLPVAFDSFGNDVLIGLSDGIICFRNHETNTVAKIADDLKEFLDACTSKPISEKSIKSVEEREKDLIERGKGHVINEALRDMWRAEIKKYSSISLEEVII